MQLPSLEKDFPKNPETQFFRTLFEVDGEAAKKSYESFLKAFPNNIFADAALFRLIQMDVAKGRYQQAHGRFIELQKNYAQSQLLRKAAVWFDSLPKDTLTPVIDISAKIDSSASKGKYRLQIGAFSELRNAQELKSKLEKKGYGPFEFSEKTVDSKKLSLLWLGQYSTKETANKAGEVFKEKEKINFSVVEK